MLRRLSGAPPTPRCVLIAWVLAGLAGAAALAVRGGELGADRHRDPAGAGAANDGRRADRRPAAAVGIRSGIAAAGAASAVAAVRRRVRSARTGRRPALFRQLPSARFRGAATARRLLVDLERAELRSRPGAAGDRPLAG